MTTRLQETDRKIIEIWPENYTWKVMAEIVGIPLSTFGSRVRDLREAGYPLESRANVPGRQLHIDQQNTVYEALADGVSESDLAKKYSTTVSRIRQAQALVALRRKRFAEKQALSRVNVPDDTRTLTGRLLGDPLPGRSALETRKPKPLRPSIAIVPSRDDLSSYQRFG